ncbi:MAG: hypothetical protein P8010_04025 [Desulfosarcinaceae bacterium]
MSVEGVSLTFQESEADLAARLVAELPKMTAFLADRGLPVVTPLSVIVDPERDRPGAEVHLIPHREIRIPVRAPGVFEDGCLEADPWAYFLFLGLCRHAIFQQVGGLPKALRYLFGQVMSPNVLSPAWIYDGVGYYLYRAYAARARPNPFDDMIRSFVPPPDLAHLSNSSETWPGPEGYRIYGRSFIAWVVDRYGWPAVLAFFRFHGRGLLPVEVTTKAVKAFGATWEELWRQYRDEWRGLHSLGDAQVTGGIPLEGMSRDGRSFWNAGGVSPGPRVFGRRGRYGFRTEGGELWLSELEDGGVYELVAYRREGVGKGPRHTWDAGAGWVAVGRAGRRPLLLLFDPEAGFDAQPRRVPAPPGVIQLSGPVRGDHGEVAVAANSAGNWDIWIFDHAWHRITDTPAMEVDPWIEGGRLLFASNRGGRFQLYAASGGATSAPISDCATAALLPRGERYLCLGRDGWRLKDLAVATASDRPSLTFRPAPTQRRPSPEESVSLPVRPYSALETAWPNYIRPDMFYRGSDFQLGLATWGEDLARAVEIDGGFRYSFDLDYISWRVGGRSHGLGARLTRYPIEYDPLFRPSVEEDRTEAKLFWDAFDDPELTVSGNYRHVAPLYDAGKREDLYWGGLHLEREWGMGALWSDLEVFEGGGQSLFGGGRLHAGRHIVTTLQMMAGKTWGRSVAGTTTYRIGGNVAEGYFTQRPSRLFPIRGFSQDLLENDAAAVSHLEIFWPLANLQKGYGTLPLFFHRLRLGTFVDVGTASDTLAGDQFLVGAGAELVTSMEIIWGFRSLFRLGIAWPVHQPDALDERGPVFLIQLGRPL